MFLSKLSVFRSILMKIFTKKECKLINPKTLSKDLVETEEFEKLCRDFGTKINLKNVYFGEEFMHPPKPSKLCEHVALITGGLDNVGIICARDFLEEGIKGIMIADTDEKRGREILTNFCHFGAHRAAFIKTDRNNDRLLKNAFDITMNHFSKIDVLVNVVGHDEKEHWDRQIDSNIKGVVRSTLLGYEYMGAQNGGKGGTILNVICCPKASTIPVFLGAKHYIIAFGKAMSCQNSKDSCVKLVTVCAAEEAFHSLKNDEVRDGQVNCNIASVVLLAENGSIWTTEC